MTAVKLVGKPSASANEAITRHAQTLYDTTNLDITEARHELDGLATGLEALLLLGRPVPE